MKYISFILCLSALFFDGCKSDWDAPCRAPYVQNEGFTESERARFPFSGTNDTLGYVNAAGDSVGLRGLSKAVFCACWPVHNNPECPADSAGYENDQYMYADSAGKLNLQINVHHFVDSPMIVHANNSVFKVPFTKIGVKDSLVWFDSLQFGNKMFYRVQALVNGGGDSLYYHPVYGVVAFRQGAQRFYIYRFNKN